jgi:hypothetical protein
MNIMRSLLAGSAAIWFAINAMAFIPGSTGVAASDSVPGGLDGDPGPLAVTLVARTLFFGLALLSAAVIEWDRLAKLIRETPTVEVAD